MVTYVSELELSRMSIPAPHFLLFSQGEREEESRSTGNWRFVLTSMDGSEKLEVMDQEPEVSADRMDLLAVVRGLEALDQPSRVTLVTQSGYVTRGFRHGLGVWRENNWQWERFGNMMPVRNGDLWRRVDRAMEYHTVDCGLSQIGGSEPDSAVSKQTNTKRQRPRILSRFTRSLIGKLRFRGRS